MPRTRHMFEPRCRPTEQKGVQLQRAPDLQTAEGCALHGRPPLSPPLVGAEATGTEARGGGGEHVLSAASSQLSEPAPARPSEIPEPALGRPKVPHQRWGKIKRRPGK